MDERKKKKINRNILIVDAVAILLLAVGMIIWVIYQYYDSKEIQEGACKNTNEPYYLTTSVSEKRNLDTENKEFVITSERGLRSLIKELSKYDVQEDIENIQNMYSKQFFKDKNLIVVRCFETGSSLVSHHVKSMTYQNDVAKLIISTEKWGWVSSSSSNYYIFVPVCRKNVKKVEVSFGSGKDSDNDNDSDNDITKMKGGTFDKPILYLYPTEKMDITVTMEHPENIKTSYPKYMNAWQVTASPNGDLKDKQGKYYYALYWDEKSVQLNDFKEGFYVTKESAITFLEEKLEILGLNVKEKNEFIMYWLPKLEENEQSLVYFEQTQERQSHNALNITPTPDSLLRILIHIKKVDHKVEIKEQTLQPFERKGFTVVEWGGTLS